MPKADAVIVGGGIGGLAAAHALMKRGRSFVLLEAGEGWGGVIRSVQRDGFRFEGGPDTILAQKPEGVALCRELGVELRPTNLEQRAVYVMHRGTLHPLPEGMVLGIPVKVGPMLRSRLFSWPGKVRMGEPPCASSRGHPDRVFRNSLGISEKETSLLIHLIYAKR